jgi:hypothetical protein
MARYSAAERPTLLRPDDVVVMNKEDYKVSSDSNGYYLQNMDRGGNYEIFETLGILEIRHSLAKRVYGSAGAVAKSQLFPEVDKTKEGLRVLTDLTNLLMDLEAGKKRIQKPNIFDLSPQDQTILQAIQEFNSTYRLGIATIIAAFRGVRYQDYLEGSEAFTFEEV